MSRRYAILDVFTDTALAGNPLAVVFDSEGLDTERMQAIAREFNLSETVFVTAPENPAHSAAIRIFTPGRELPFAGHPTVGTAVVLGMERLGGNGDMDAIVVLEETVGAVRCAVSQNNGGHFAEFDLPKLPERLAIDLDEAAIAAALGLGPHEIGFENHTITAWSAGVPYICVPVHGLDAVAKVSVTGEDWLALDLLGNGQHVAPYIYCRDTVHLNSGFHARMLAPWDGIREDPATGSAAAAFIGAVAHFDKPRGGLHRFIVEQGLEMGRPSFIHVELDMEGGAATGARIGGHAVVVARGTLEL